MRTTTHHAFTAIAMAAALAILLGACASEQPGDSYPDLTLAQVKSSVQLLRNDAAARIPSESIAEVLVSSDLSAACESEATDPEGAVRAWRSGARLVLVSGADVDGLVSGLVRSFVDQGWELAAGSTTERTALSRSLTFTDIVITTLSEGEQSGSNSELLLDLKSPCVLTDGANSSEVRTLEALTF